MSHSTEAQNKAFVLGAFDTLFNKRDAIPVPSNERKSSWRFHFRFRRSPRQAARGASHITVDPAARPTVPY
jgi:hypothetical protein